MEALSMYELSVSVTYLFWISLSSEKQVYFICPVTYCCYLVVWPLAINQRHIYQSKFGFVVLVDNRLRFRLVIRVV
jgi:hypothetical protein